MKPLTTTQAAKLLGVCTGTIIKLCERGELKWWRIPGSKHRRISRESFAEMVERHGMVVNGNG